jgi:hypothetical protein
LAPSYAVRDTSRTEIELIDVLLLGAPDGGDELLGDTVIRRVPKRNKAEARRLFKKLAREVCEWNGTAWRKRYIQGKTSFEMGRFHLVLRKDAVELTVDIPPGIWKAFS